MMVLCSPFDNSGDSVRRFLGWATILVFTFPPGLSFLPRRGIAAAVVHPFSHLGLDIRSDTCVVMGLQLVTIRIAVTKCMPTVTKTVAPTRRNHINEATRK